MIRRRQFVCFLYAPAAYCHQSLFEDDRAIFKDSVSTQPIVLNRVRTFRPLSIHSLAGY